MATNNQFNIYLRAAITASAAANTHNEETVFAAAVCINAYFTMVYPKSMAHKLQRRETWHDLCDGELDSGWFYAITQSPMWPAIKEACLELCD